MSTIALVIVASSWFDMPAYCDIQCPRTDQYVVSLVQCDFCSQRIFEPMSQVPMRKRSNPSSSPDAPIAKHAKGRGQAFGRGRSCSFESPASHVHHGLRAASSRRRLEGPACYWCDSPATAASARGGENDQYDLRSKFHQQVMSAMP